MCGQIAISSKWNRGVLSQMIRLWQTTCYKLQEEDDNVNMKNHKVAQISSKKPRKEK